MNSPEKLITELLGLLTEAQDLGLTFSVGSAYISRQYIDKQCELNARIRAVKREYDAAITPVETSTAK
jgi:hypothetical protein